MALRKYVYFGYRFHHGTNGAWGYLIDDGRTANVDWEDMCEAILRGDEVHVRPADAGEIAWAESQLAILRATKAATQTAMQKE